MVANNVVEQASDSETFHPRAALYFGLAVMMVMAACFGYVLVQALDWLFPRAELGYLLPFGIFVSFEALISTSILFWEDDFSPRRLSFRAVEWIVLIVLAKALSYLSIGFDQLAVDLLLWDEQFSTFFTLEFTAGSCFTALIWLMTSSLATLLMRLFGSREVLDLELEGISIVDRSALRRRLVGWIFTAGSFMLAIVSLIDLSPRFHPGAFTPIKADFLPVEIFFICGLVLLSQAQLFNLWSRWYLNHIRVGRGIWGRWVLLTLVVIAGSALVASLLPTGYSIGLLRTLQIAIGYLLYLIAYFQFVLSTLFFLLLTLLSNLFGQPRPNTPPQLESPPAPMAPPGVTFSTPLWVELLRSLFFWTVFLSVIFFAFRHYFRQSEEVVEVLRRQPYLSWLFRFFNWLKSILHWTKNIPRGWSAIFPPRKRATPTERTAIYPKAMPAYGKLPPRTRIRLIYLQMTEWLDAKGHPRQKSQSPAEFARQLVAVFPAAAGEICSLTELFIVARYSQAAVTPLQAATAEECWKAIQRIFANTLEESRSAYSSDEETDQVSRH